MFQEFYYSYTSILSSNIFLKMGFVKSSFHKFCPSFINNFYSEHNGMAISVNIYL